MKQAVEKKIRELIPELQEWTFSGERAKDKEDSFMGLKGEREDIHLEHVLRAYYTNTQYHPPFIMGEADRLVIELYDLSKPFSEQSEELYSFLAELLEVTQ